MISSVASSPYIPPAPASTQALQSREPASSPAGSAFDIALQLQEAQYTNLERTLEAQTQLLDLLV